MTNTEKEKKKERTKEKIYFVILLKKIRRRLSDVVFKWHWGQSFFSCRYFNQHSSQFICQQLRDTHGFIHDCY